MNPCTIRLARPEDQPGAYYVCMRTGDNGGEGEHLYRDDPDCLGRIFVGPYLAYETELAMILEDADGICGYSLAALDSKEFYRRYEEEWRPELVAQFPMPAGDPAGWTRTQRVHSWYHNADYFCPEPYDQYPSHLHIDLLPRAQGRGYGRKLIEAVAGKLQERGSPGAHLGVAAVNQRAIGFYQRLGFSELARDGASGDQVIYMGKRL